MTKTIIITGASTGIGKDTAQYFLEKGWNVVATMRNVNDSTFSSHAQLLVEQLDVTVPESITAVIDKTVAVFGRVDVMLNNAGYGAMGPVEAATEAQIKAQYDVNVFGVINSIRAVLPQMRKQKSGTIISVTSAGGLMAVPMYALYNSTKFAVEGLSEGMWYELKQFGIDIKVIEPGGIQTDFSTRSAVHFDTTNFPEYDGFFTKVRNYFGSSERAADRAKPIIVAQAIYEAATDGKDTLRYLVGKDAKQLMNVRKFAGYKRQMKIVYNTLLKK